jgi:hypothetical protein
MYGFDVWHSSVAVANPPPLPVELASAISRLVGKRNIFSSPHIAEGKSRESAAALHAFILHMQGRGRGDPHRLCWTHHRVVCGVEVTGALSSPAPTPSTRNFFFVFSFLFYYSYVHTRLG